MVKNATKGDRGADFDREREDIAGLYRLEGDVISGKLAGVAARSRQKGGFFSLMSGLFEGTVDADIGILVETGVTFEAGRGIFVTTEDMEIVLEEAETPFEAFERVVVFEGMRLALGLFDEFAICYTGSGPVCREMVGIELV